MVNLLFYISLSITVPAVSFFTVLSVYRVLRFLEYNYIVSWLVLRDIKEKYQNLFFNIKCFFALFGFSLLLFLVFLYFYTSAFPAIIFFFRTPLFWLGKVALSIRLLNKLIMYREIKRLDSSVTIRKFLLAGGGPLVPFSGKGGSNGVQTLLTTPTQFGAADRMEKSMRIKEASRLSNQHVDTLVDSGCLTLGSKEAQSIKVSYEVSNTHF